ncbi:formate hydrogenlyase subunit 3/multisubunit Na+/H+ antiporter MnhD subunit [Paraburkholderia sp. MM5496-R1]|uniref:hypothetical protein n=1 Tax=Paraburkholderia sp. MM5496-R1 TaxID=2991065 RepID=UPI003D20E4AC
MDARHLKEVADAVAPPAFGFAANLLLRGKEAFRTSGADWLLVLWVFDLSAALTVDQFLKLIPSQTFRTLADNLFIILMVVTILIWLAVAIYIEPQVRTDALHWRQRAVKLGLSILAYVLAMAFTALNIYIFIYGG